MNRSTTIKIKSIDNGKITGINMEGEDKNKMTDIDMNRNIYLALLAEMKKVNITIDEDLNCFTNRIFTIFEREWKGEPVYGAALRKDLETLNNETI